MTTLHEAAQQALEALEVATTPLAKDRQEVLRAQAALRAALEQEQAEPVAYLRCAKWLDPECADKGACQSLRFKRQAALAQEQAEPVAWVASKDGRVIYDAVSTDDVVLRVSGDFEDDGQRIRYTQQIVDALNAALLQRTMVPLTEAEIERIGMTHQSLRQVARAIEKASWEKNNHGQA